MKRIAVRFPEEDYQRLESLAAAECRSVAELIREAITEHLCRGRKRSALELTPHNSGRMLRGWDRAEVYDEMLA